MTFVVLIIALVFVVADFVSKNYILNNVSVGETFGGFGPLFDFTYVQNTGAAFGMFSGKMNILAFVSLAFCVGIIVYYIIKKPKEKLFCIALAMIFAGALGNGIDRLFYGFVVDFIETTFIDFPVFNIADIAVCVGVFLLGVYIIFFDKEDKLH